ncbi:hypothetical protein IEQ34_018381 [Dendrobium chrysotoxum]|uniref:Uncharacterized protein n=1 Tax=Dendrobium chrysotoxum TaxID=161865 RepID=A0AAV7GE34_DENCH|nr:hypothetical protein IEQ34_018381 [Dendrobium chrysotoxum]
MASLSTGYSVARTERMVLAVTRGGSFSGSAVEMNTSIPGRSERPIGFDGEGDSNFSWSAARSAARLMGLIFVRMSRSQEKANQISQAVDKPHSHKASVFAFDILQIRKAIRQIRRPNTNNLFEFSYR